MKYHTVFLGIFFLSICFNALAGPLSEKELMAIANQEVISLGGNPAEMTAYIDLFSFDRSLTVKTIIWKKIKARMNRVELWEIHYLPKEAVFDGEFYVLIEKKTGKVFATFDMSNGTILK